MSDQTQTEAPLLHDTVTPEWMEVRLPSAFARSHEEHAAAMRLISAALIAEAGIAPGDHVLDVACGSGIPAFGVAKLVGPDGSVTATDPSPVMIDAMRRNARELGLRNLRIVQVSAATLDFPAGSFDAATCQFGVMFFPDVRAALERIRGVLRPGARAAFLAWGSLPQNHFFGAFWRAASSYLPPDLVEQRMAPPSPGQPAPGRFAAAGSLSAELTAAGFTDVHERTEQIDVLWPGSAESLVEDQISISGIEEQVPADRRADFRAEAAGNFRQFRDGAGLRVPSSVVIASGQA